MKDRATFLNYAEIIKLQTKNIVSQKKPQNRKLGEDLKPSSSNQSTNCGAVKKAVAFLIMVN